MGGREEGKSSVGQQIRRSAEKRGEASMLSGVWPEYPGWDFFEIKKVVHGALSCSLSKELYFDQSLNGL
jgi:hypothetical protein